MAKTSQSQRRLPAGEYAELLRERLSLALQLGCIQWLRSQPGVLRTAAQAIVLALLGGIVYLPAAVAISWPDRLRFALMTALCAVAAQMAAAMLSATVMRALARHQQRLARRLGAVRSQLDRDQAQR
jgi:hypothetical protein